MSIRLHSGQYRLLSRYAEDVSKATLLYNVAGYFFPSILQSAFQPTLFQLLTGAVLSLTFLVIALILENKARRIK
ncbi:hypothetical protein HY086_03090 [Candidatus Gottesmanbacteria bacterium]|nr:hypothetical protein [Candidatus Gottesmanbacteria bacterium]